MLLWRPNERNKYIFLLELIIISTCAHGILGIFLFILYKDGSSSLHIELGQSRNPTLFVPLKKSSMTIAGNRSGQATPNQKDLTNKSYKNSDPEKNKQKTPSHKKRIGSGTSLGFAPKTDIRKASSTKKEANATLEKPAIKKTKQHKNKIKAKKQEQPEIKKVTTKKNEPIKATEEEIVQPKKSPIAAEQPPSAPIENTNNRPTEPVTQPAPLTKEPEQKHPELPIGTNNNDQQSTPNEQKLLDGMPMDEIIIGHENNAADYMNAEEAHMHECIEQEIMARWKLPRGLPKELNCQIKCCMGADGTVSSCTLEKTSGVLIYDMAARSAARAMTLPRWAWGKEFTIVFKQ